MKKMNVENITRTVKMHPASTALAFLYTLIFIAQGNPEVFLAGVSASFGACILEMLFFATGAIRIRRGRVRIAPSVSAAEYPAHKKAAKTARESTAQSMRKSTEQAARKTIKKSVRRNAGLRRDKNEVQAAKLKVTRIRQKTAA